MMIPHVLLSLAYNCHGFWFFAIVMEYDIKMQKIQEGKAIEGESSSSRLV